MSSTELLNSLWANGSYALSDPFLKPLPYIGIALVGTILFYSAQRPKSNVPLLNPKRPFELTNTRAKMEMVVGAGEMLRKWFTAQPSKPTRVISDSGEMTILPPHMANEIRNDQRLIFRDWVSKAFHSQLPGFEGFRESARESRFMQAVIMNDLTKFLSKVTEPLADETARTLPELLGDSQDCHVIPLRETMLTLVARISSRVFLGEELCRNEAWLKITREYTIAGFMAAEKLRLWPSPLRFVVHWFLPSCRKARAQVKEAREIFNPVLEKRRRQKAEGRDSEEFNDAIEWIEKESKGAYYDPVAAQLSLSSAAIHTTTDLISQVLICLANQPETLEALRKEISLVVGEGGWKKTSLYSMKLLDSVIKESQRMKPIGIVSLRRIALQDVTLSDGTIIPKGHALAVSAHSMWDAKIHENPGEWDGYRFYNMRNMPGKENVAQLVSTSADHLGFGHGQHACPGRFFAANEIKIILVHLLMMYDWALPEGAMPEARRFGFDLTADPFLKMEVRKREGEIGI